MDIPRTPVCMKLLKLSYKLSQLGNSVKEMTASTNGGTKSEDTNLLFPQKKKERETAESLHQLVSRIQEFQEGVPMDMDMDMTELLQEDVPMDMDMTELLGLPDELRESSVIDEMRESVRKGELNPVQVLKLGAILCDVESGPIWVRVKEGILYLTRSQTDLKPNQWRALLWVLIGASASQVVEEEGEEGDLTLEATKKNICTHYRRAVDENIPSLDTNSPLFPLS